MVKKTALDVYEKIIEIFLEGEDFINSENMTHFQSHVPLISIGKDLTGRPLRNLQVGRRGNEVAGIRPDKEGLHGGS